MGGRGGNQPQQQQHSALLFGDDEVQEWINPCGGKFDPTLSTTEPIKKTNQRELYEALLTSTQIAINEISNLKAISTSDLSAWYKKYNNTFSFLPTNPANRPKLWYNDTQMYVAAFQFLYKKQLAYDKINNDGNAESEELRTLMTQAKSLLCEIETFINVTMKGNKVKIFSKQEMSDILKFRSNDSNVKSVLETVDKMFTKAKFQEYINELLPAIKKREKNSSNNAQGKRRLPTNCKKLPPNRVARCQARKRAQKEKAAQLQGKGQGKGGPNNAARQRLNKNKINNMNNNKRKQNLAAQNATKKPNPNPQRHQQQQKQQQNKKQQQTIVRTVRKELKSNALLV